MNEKAMKTGKTLAIKCMLYEKVLRSLGYNVENIRQCLNDEILINTLNKPAKQIITDSQMSQKWNVPLINYLLSDHDLEAYANEHAKDMWVYLDDDYDLNVFWNEDYGEWQALVVKASGGYTITRDQVKVNWNTKEIILP